MTPTMVNQQLFYFTVKLNATNSFPSNTAEVRPIYLNRGHVHEKTCFCYMWTTKAQISLRIHAVWSAPLLFAACIVTIFYSSKLYTSIGTYTISNLSVCGMRLFKSKFHPAGTVLHWFCLPVSMFCDKSFDKKNIYIYILWLLGHRFLYCERTRNQSL